MTPQHLSSTSPLVAASGMTQTDSAGRQRYDLLAAMASCLGHGDERLRSVLLDATAAFLGSGPIPRGWLSHPAPSNRFVGNPLSSKVSPDNVSPDNPLATNPLATNPLATNSLADLSDESSTSPSVLAEFANVVPVPSAAQANDLAIQLARAVGGAGGSDRRRGEGAREAYRILVPLGTDPGETLGCRAASGRVDPSSTLGPLVPGFRHVAPGDPRALEKAIDDQTAAVLMSPVDWHRGGMPWNPDYLPRVRELCDARGVLLILDETRLPPVSGRWFLHQHAEVTADLVTVSAGWTGGLPGGLVLVGRSAAIPNETLDRLVDTDCPLVAAIARATVLAVESAGGPASVADLAECWRGGLEELVAGFEFLGEATNQGLWTVVSTDVDARAVATVAAKAGVLLGVSSDTTLIACPPITTTPELLDAALGNLRHGLETLERETIES